MPESRPAQERSSHCRIAGCLVAVLLAALAPAAGAQADAAGRLLAKHAELRSRLGDNQFRKPLHLDSSQSATRVTGDVHALLEHPFAVLASALRGPGDWCEILILHINTKYCRASPVSPESNLNVWIGKNTDQPLDQAYAVSFRYRVAARTPDYLQVTLDADAGPLGTRDYRIVFEAVALEGGRTFIHLSYGYGFGAMARLALQVYLGTVGRNKVGFTVAGTRADGRPLHIGGPRGATERHTMRYFLAIEAFLGALSAPPLERLEKRLHDWFAATERYPRQLHEIEQGKYLDMKRREHQRQQAGLRQPRTSTQETAHVQDAGAG
jgi:hypothetical protein